MNQELIEIILSIYQKDEIYKVALCGEMPKRSCEGVCNVCPLGHIHVTINGRSHYLKHLIILRGEIKYEP